MSLPAFDATILLEEPPEVEFNGGLFYVTDRIGGLVIRRCMRPNTFLKLVKRGKMAIDEFTNRDQAILTQLRFSIPPVEDGDGDEANVA